MTDVKQYRVAAGKAAELDERPTSEDGGLDKPEGQHLLREAIDRLRDLQELLYAGQQHALLVVLQAMDAGGKDSTIRNVFGPINPQGCRVTSFKAPSSMELAHDYLWRIHRAAPARGMIGVFNRSHYEDVLVVRVKDLVPPARWRRRYEHINAFEQMLHDEGMTIVKFYLNISKDYQRRRLQRRLDRPDKRWKFNPADLEERARWEAYRGAAEEAMSRCSTPHAPWYIVPAERRWYRNLVIASVLVETLSGLRMEHPKPDFNPGAIEIV